MGHAVSSAPEGELRHLVDAAINGDNAALGQLVRHTQPLVWQICRALGSPGEEEDLVQETYLRAMRSLESYRRDAPVPSWLAAIARNVCADHVRRRSRQSRLMERLRIERPRPAGDESSAAIDDLVRTLDPERREAFVLTQVCGLSYMEAAAALGCPIGTIRSRVARARAELVDQVLEAEAR